MNCPKCNKPNRPQALFCKHCGESLSASTGSPLDELVAMVEVKAELQSILALHKSIKDRERRSGVTMDPISLNIIITGEAGSGRKKLVSVIQRLFKSAGIISAPKCVDLNATRYQRHDEDVDNAIKAAKGGILCISDAHKLVAEGVANENCPIDELLNSMDEWRGKSDAPRLVIVTGLPKLARYFMENQGARARFDYQFDLPEYTVDEELDICCHILKYDRKLEILDDARQKLLRILRYERRSGNAFFTGGNLAKQKAEEIFRQVCMSGRTQQADTVIADDVQGTEFVPKSLDEIFAQLDEFVGVDEIKEGVRKLANKIELERQQNGPDAPVVLKDHYLFLGNPGTGKTSIARVFADVLNSLGVLPIGQLVEVDRSQLVSNYVGDTAKLVRAAFDRANGGVLFVDEAYALSNGDNDTFGKEAVDTLMKLAEDRRGQLVVILAGYTKEMGEFLQLNSGMSSRFNEVINFRDYNAEELTEIFRRFVKKAGKRLDVDAEERAINFFQKMYMTRTKGFGNAREVRNTFERALKNQSDRILMLQNQGLFQPGDAEIITLSDIEGAEGGKELTVDEVMAELDEFVGMENVKKQIRSIAQSLQFEREKMKKGIGRLELQGAHMVITGRPGTGKSTIARKMGQIFKAIGLLPTDKVVERERKTLLDSYSNSAGRNMEKACDEAMGGVLFIDEAYTLLPISPSGAKDQGGDEAVNALMTRMENDKGKFVVIMAGYKQEMEEFVDNANAGLRRRISYFIHIDDYSAEELYQIFMLRAKKHQLTFTPEARELLRKCIDEMVATKDEKFGNAGEMVKLFEAMQMRQANRLMPIPAEQRTREAYLTIEASDIPYDPPKKIDVGECLAQLDELTGLQAVKDEVRRLAEYLMSEQERAQELGEKAHVVADHYLFIGNPGTGKTTVARIMGNIFYSLGLLPSNKVVDVTAKDLVASYVGQTGKQTEQVVHRAIGGVLFIDEAYSLDDGPHGFGQEASATLLRLLLDYKGRLICIAAGYPYEMKKWISTNTGLPSRFNKTICFDDYDAAQLAEIFVRKAAKDKLQLTPMAEAAMHQYFEQLVAHKDQNFGNAREVNNYYDNVRVRQGGRLRQMKQNGVLERSDFFVLEESDMKE